MLSMLSNRFLHGRLSCHLLRCRYGARCFRMESCARLLYQVTALRYCIVHESVTIVIDASPVLSVCIQLPACVKTLLLTLLTLLTMLRMRYCIGPTITSFAETAGALDAVIFNLPGMAMQPADVAKDLYRGIFSGMLSYGGMLCDIIVCSVAFRPS
jgi:hypothetical protein